MTAEQYQHAIAELLRIAGYETPDECPGIAITRVKGERPDESFWVVRDRGGILNGLELRIAFETVPARRSLVVLAMMDIPAETKLPYAVVILCRYRLRRFLES